MSGPPLGAPLSSEGGPGSAAQCVAGCMYQVVQTTGPDGKNLLKLLPISNSSGNFMPLVQSSVMPDTTKGNIPSPVQFTLKTQLASNTASSSLKIPAFNSTNPGKIILTRTLDKQENISVIPEKDSLTTKPVSNIQSNSLSVDRLSLQNVAVSTSSNQSNTAYVLVNTKRLPVTVKSPVLPSGHHLQIPAHAEVKSVPASSLPPTVQQKILAAAAANASGAAEATKMPTVIYVSPVNTVKTVIPKRLQTICPKPVKEASEPFILTTTQTTVQSSIPLMVAADGKQCQQTPMKWVVQENSQASIPRLVPVKSSNNVASKILKTLADMKNVEKNPANILQICSNSPSGSQTKITPIKDNALVMYNGKVYLLTKRGSEVLSAQVDQQTSSGTDAPFKKDTSQLITNKVVNLVLSKNKGMTLTQKDPKLSITTEPVLQPDLRRNLKPAPTLLPTSSVNQNIITMHQCRLSPSTEGISSGTIPVKKMVTDENMHCNSKEKSHSPNTATAVKPQSKQHCAFSEEQKIQNEKVCSSETATEIKHKRESSGKQYLELRKRFGLFKEERVYLKRIPLRKPPTGLEASVCSSNNLKKNDFCSASPQGMPVTTRKQNHDKEEKIIVDLEQQDLIKKRKAKLSPVPENGKRRKMAVKSAAINPNMEDNSTSSVILNKSISPTPALLQPKNPPASIRSSLGRDSEQDPGVPDGKVEDTCCPALGSSEGDGSASESSFREDAFPSTPLDLDETVRDEKIKRLKRLLREREAALEEIRKKMQQT